MKLGAAIQALAADLNDVSTITWQEDQLRRWLLEGMLEYSTTNPNALATDVVIKVGCDTPTELDCCEQVLNVVGQSTESGQLLHRLYSISHDALWPGSSSRCGTRNKLSEYTIEDDGKSISFYPRPLPGSDIYVLVKCIPSLESMSADGVIPEELVPAVMQWALFRALSMDAENNPAAFNLAQQHRVTFNELISRKESAEDKKELRRLRLWPQTRRRSRSR